MFKYLLILLLTSCIESNNCPASTEKQINSNSVARAEINCVKPETYSMKASEASPVFACHPGFGPGIQ